MKELLPEEDKNLAYESIILKLLITSLDYDIEAIKNSKLKLKKPHVDFLESIRNHIIKDLSAVKKTMYKRGIKVFDHEVVNDDFWSYKYIVRGYESEFRCFTHGLKMSTEKALAKYYLPSEAK